jgi:hypothetical protein
VLKFIERYLLKEGLNVSPINKHEIYVELCYEERVSPSTTNIGMVDSESQENSRWLTQV